MTEDTLNDTETLAEGLASIIFDQSLNNPRTNWLMPTARAVLGSDWLADLVAARTAALARDRDALAAKIAAVWSLGEGWVGFDDSHHYGNALLTALDSPPAALAGPEDTARDGGA